MEKNIRNIVVVFFIPILFVACSGAADVDYGDALIYMPQSIVQSGGINNNFTVKLTPSQSDTIVPVGIYRSGLESLNEFSVELVVDTDSLTKAIGRADSMEQYAFYKNVEILPDNCYTLPTKIEVKEGERESWGNLIIHREKLFLIWSGNKKYVLPIRIKNSSKYTINQELSLTMFVLEK
jgi:hypothetical protein